MLRGIGQYSFCTTYTQKMDTMPGYAVIAMSATKIPGVGTGLGYGVVVDSRSDERSYIKVTQFEVGGGLGAQKFTVVILFKDEAPLDRMIKGGWRFESAADFASGSGNSGTSAPISSKSGKGYKVFRLSESGVLATITIRLLHGKRYLDN
jgi:lipid-binding SYLF domain-containing protein